MLCCLPLSIVKLVERELVHRDITWNTREMNLNGIQWSNVSQSKTFTAKTMFLGWNWPPHVSVSELKLNEKILSSTDENIGMIKESDSSSSIPITVSVDNLYLPPNPVCDKPLSGSLYPLLQLNDDQETIFIGKLDGVVSAWGSFNFSLHKPPLQIDGPAEFKLTKSGTFEITNIKLSSEFLPSMPLLSFQGTIKNSSFSGELLLGELSTKLTGTYSTDPLSIQTSFVTELKLESLLNTFRIPERERVTAEGSASLSGQYQYPESDLTVELTNITWTTTQGDLFNPNTFYRGVIPYTPLNSDEIRLVGPASRSWVPFKKQGWMPAATIAAEDSAFLRHKGYDPEGLQIAIEELLSGDMNPRGGSTLTQQLAKNLFLNGEKHLTRKLRELIYALELERVLSKDEILEIYLNVVEFGPEIYGIKQASAQYFVKPPAALTLKEAAYLASVLPAPTHHYKARQNNKRLSQWKVNNILNNMKDGKSITPAQLNLASKQSLRVIVPQQVAPN